MYGCRSGCVKRVVLCVFAENFHFVYICLNIFFCLGETFFSDHLYGGIYV